MLPFAFDGSKESRRVDEGRRPNIAIDSRHAQLDRSVLGGGFGAAGGIDERFPAVDCDSVPDDSQAR